VQPEQSWRDLTLDKVIEAQRRRFGSAAGFTFFFAGSFTLEQIEPLLTRYLGSLRAGDAIGAWRDLGIRQARGPATRITARGADPRAMLLLYDSRDEISWTLRDTHLVWSLGNILQRALLDKLRIEQGSVYALKVGSTLEKIPNAWYGLEIVVPCAPGEIDAMVGGVNREIERLRSEGPSADEVHAEIESQRRALEKEAQGNGDWLWKLELIYKYEEGFGRLENPEALLGLVTAKNLREAAQRYWRTDQWLRYELSPQK
jgi:zinc protease